MAEPDNSEPSLQQFVTIPRPTFSRQEYKAYKELCDQRLKIFDLIERFYHQIRYGCTAETCNTKTCRTSRTQKARGAPYRVPTQITARAIAAYMAVLDDPYKHLCSNTPAPRPSPFDTAFPTSKGLYSLIETPNEYIDKILSQAKHETSISQAAEWFAKAEMEEWLVNQSYSDSPVNLGSPSPYSSDTNIDTRSFTQRLFSSLEWRLRHVLQTSSQPSQPEHQLAKHNDRDSSKKAVIEAIKIADLASNITQVPREALEYQVLLEKGRQNTFQKFLDQMGPSEQSLTQPTCKDSLVDTKDITNLSVILSDPSKLVFHALSPSPLSSMLSDLPVEDSTQRLVFFSSGSSHPLSFLYLDFASLEGHPQIESNCHLQWLTSSVKSTYYDLNSAYNIPSSAAANIIAFAVSALVASVRKQFQLIQSALWSHFEDFRQKGRILCGMHHKHDYAGLSEANEMLTGWVLAYEEPAAQSLMKLVLRSFASWSYASSPLATSNQIDDLISNTRKDTEIQESRCDFKDRLLHFLSPSLSIATLNRYFIPALIEWVRTIFLREWNGEARFRWDSDVGAAIEFMNWLYSNRVELDIHLQHFVIDVLTDRMDYVEACKDWLEFKATPLTGHLLSLPWIMTTDTKFTMFRSISLCQMFAAYESSETMNNMVRRMTKHVKPTARQLFDRLSTSMETFLVLDIRRDDILRNCFDQLWRRQKRELFKPLKVKMGMNEGEEGVDMGGVQQEFFRLAIADALDPAHGLFTIDGKTRMTWFQPMSTAPLYQFTLIGLLFGLAVYNGITLTVTFPLAFYRKLLSIENTSLEHIEDGWPELHTGLNSLISWSDGKVEDVFLRSYTFSFEALGKVHHVDMQRYTRDTQWPLEHNIVDNKSKARPNSSPQLTNGSSLVSEHRIEEETEMVTNDNRVQYVKDYVYWLTEKSIAPQFEAFKSGFNLPLHKRALRLLSPQDLQTLLEGHHAIDIEGLRQTAHYEDKFDAKHPRIKEFWEIVRDMTEDQHKKLLEFVTASPRVPARGISEVLFTIQRNGVGDEHLPTSMTCFGRLLLPEYSSKEIMAEKLKLAIENSTGFGTQ